MEIQSVPVVVVGDDGLESGFLLVWFLGVVLLFLLQVFLKLLHVGIAIGRWRENAGNIQRDKIGIGLAPVVLNFLEKVVILDGFIDGAGRKYELNKYSFANTVTLSSSVIRLIASIDESGDRRCGRDT